MKNIIGKINETGTLLIEAIAMLGLISMVTPVLYKKAAERTAELQDINASSQLRAIASAMDSFLTDNFAKIVSGTTISNDADFSQFDLTATETSATISVAALKDYLPYGMMSGNSIRSTKLIPNSTTRLVPSNPPGGNPTSEPHDNYQIVVKLNQQFEGQEPVVQTLTGFIIAEPREGIVNNTRAARIASMVGSNGGYITGNNVNGVQGVWSVAKNDLDSGMQDNTIVISSLQPISSQGLSNEKVLYRVDMPNDGNDQDLNTMTTDLFMGKDANSTRNIRMVNQIVMMPNEARMVGSEEATNHQSPDAINTAEIDNALYIGNHGGANIQGALQAIESLFTVRENLGENQDAGEGNPVVELRGRETQDNGATFHVGIDNMTYGNPIPGTMQLTVDDGNLVYARTENNGQGGNNASYRESLNVGESSVSAMENTLRVVRGNILDEGTGNITDSDDGYVTIGTGRSVTEQHSGPATAYGNNGSLHEDEEGNIDAYRSNEAYRLTVDGSVYAQDTIQGSKLAGYDADTAKLRAGRSRETFSAADNNDDNFFMKVMSDYRAAILDEEDHNNDIPAGSQNNRFILGRENTPFVRAADTVRPGFTVDAQRVNGGIDLLAGETTLLDENGAATNNAPQAGRIRLSAENGVNISTHDDEGYGGTYSYTPNTPVSIQDTMLQVYNNSTNGETIDTRVNKFYAVGRNGDSNDSSYYVEGMEFDIGRITDETDTKATTRIGATDRIDSIDGSDGAVLTRSILNIQPDNYGSDGNVTTRIAGGVAFYDHDADFHNTETNHYARNNYDDIAENGNPAALFIGKNKFEIRATQSTPRSITKGDLILAVDNNKTYQDDHTTYGSVYIRKGSINLGTNRASRLTNSDILLDYAASTTAQADGTPNPSDLQNMTGYIAADRFISNYSLKGSEQDIAAIQATSSQATTNMYDYGDGEKKYNKYELNPAYTSVMHDIKLTTRGGARLSDILPDFINKGIYVVDTSYAEGSVADWTDSNGFSVDHCGKSAANGCKEPGATDSGYSKDAPVSPYVGFVPTPKCPPGYAKVITLTPAGWAMAQAGKLGIDGNNRAKIDIYDAAVVLNTNSQSSTGSSGGDDDDGDGDGNGSVDENAPQPIYLDYQKSTWLRSEVRPVYEGKMNTTGDAENFNGWGLIMGFIYPATQYQSLVNATTSTTHTSGVQHGAHGTSDFTSPTGTTTENVYWNLFPVYKSEIEGYATVYCYFDRNAKVNPNNPNSNDIYDSDYVEKYNQLNKFNNDGAASVNSYEKGENNGTGANGNVYIERLNDQRLKYKDPW